MIKHQKVLTITTIVIGFIICCALLFYSGYIISNNNEIVYQENHFSKLFLFIIGIFWIFGFLCYKVFVLEDKITKLQNAENSIKELLNYIIKQNELDFINMQEFAQNTREMLLRVYYDNKSKE